MDAPVEAGIGRGFGPTRGRGMTRKVRRLEMNLILVVACALVDAHKRVLIAQRPESKTLPGLREFPGGKVDPGARPEATLIRELHDEIAITVNQPRRAPLPFA